MTRSYRGKVLRLEEIVRHRKAVVIPLIIIVLLVVIRLALPYAIKSYVNKTINRMPGYEGSLDKVELAIIRGAYAIKGLNIQKTGGEHPDPFLKASTIDLSVQWKELFHGALVGQMEVDDLELNYVESPTKAEPDPKDTKTFAETLKQLFPLRFNRFEIKNGSIHFRTYAQPPVDVHADNIYVLGENLTNSKKVSKTLVGTIQVNGRIMNTGSLDFHTELNPLMEQPTFKMSVKLTNINLPDFNDLLRHYLNMDAKKGKISLYSEVAAKDGGFNGYVKPLLSDLNLVDMTKDKKPLGTKLKERLIELVFDVFKNKPKERAATIVNFSGRFKNPHIDVWHAVGELFRNAFIQAISAGLEEKISLNSVDHPKKISGKK